MLLLLFLSLILCLPPLFPNTVLPLNTQHIQHYEQFLIDSLSHSNHVEEEEEEENQYAEPTPPKDGKILNYKWKYEEPKEESLQQIVGFQFCKQLNLAVFDVDVELDAPIVHAILNTLNISVESMVERTEQPLFQLQKYRQIARMFSPLVDPDSVPMPQESSEKKHGISIRQLGHYHFTKLVDAIALALHTVVINHYIIQPIERNRFMDNFVRAQIDPKNSKRFACFMAADGFNDWSQLTLNQKKLLRFVEGRLYFDNDLHYQWLDMDLVYKESKALYYQQLSDPPTPTHQASDEPQLSQAEGEFGFTEFIDESLERKKQQSQRTVLRKERSQQHKVAYFLLIHKDLGNVINLLNALMDPYVTILIHVDEKNPKLKTDLLDYLQFQSKTSNERNWQNIRVMQKSFKGMWGHSSLVFAQLSGFFELLTMNQEWEYVINLSGNDYPLRYNDALYKDLKGEGDVNYIEYWSSGEALSRVQDFPVLSTLHDFVGMPSSLSSDQPSEEIESILEEQGLLYEELKCMTTVLKTNDFGKMSFPYSHWPIYKHHQWMILSRSFVKNLRHSPTAMYIAAFMEFSLIPDESYFATLLKNAPLYKGRIINDSKRFLTFPIGAIHPRYITQKDLPMLLDVVSQQGKGYMRKVDVERDGWDLIRGVEKIRGYDWWRTFREPVRRVEYRERGKLRREFEGSTT